MRAEKKLQSERKAQSNSVSSILFPDKRWNWDYPEEMPFMEHAPSHSSPGRLSPGVQLTQMFREKLTQAAAELNDRNKGKYVVCKPHKHVSRYIPPSHSILCRRHGPPVQMRRSLTMVLRGDFSHTLVFVSVIKAFLWLILTRLVRHLRTFYVSATSFVQLTACSLETAQNQRLTHKELLVALGYALFPLPSIMPH